MVQELDDVLGDGGEERAPALADLTRLKYLECCIKESLRLYPPVPNIKRWIGRDVRLAGYTVPAGASVSLHLFALHRRPDLFDRADVYDPDRFASGTSDPFTFVPFSAGPRNCIGGLRHWVSTFCN